MISTMHLARLNRYIVSTLAIRDLHRKWVTKRAQRNRDASVKLDGQSILDVMIVFSMPACSLTRNDILTITARLENYRNIPILTRR